MADAQVVTGDPKDLLAGFTRAGMGYRGALRVSSGSTPVWVCRDREHLTPPKAKECAEAERDRRVQAAGVVFSLLHCEPCASWWDDAGGVTACPRCKVPPERVKVAVVERGPAVDAG
jgi:hypothetical protein